MTQITSKDIRKAVRGRFDTFRPVVVAWGQTIHRLSQCVCPNTEAVLPTALNHLLAIRERLHAFKYDRPFGHWIVRQFLNLFSIGCEAARQERNDFSSVTTYRNRMSDAVLEALQNIPRRYRETLLLRFGLEWSLEDVAAVVGVSQERLAVLISRGRWVLVHKLRHFYLRTVAHQIPSYSNKELPECCFDFRNELKNSLSLDPADDLHLEALAHSNDCPSCRIELDVYRKVKLCHTNLVPLAPDILWKTLFRHRAALLSTELMDLDRETAVEVMEQMGVKGPATWPWLIVGAFLAGAITWLANAMGWLP